MNVRRLIAIGTIGSALCVVSAAAADSTNSHHSRVHRQIMVPQEDRFSPFELIIRAGDTVEWENDDTDDHTVVSLDQDNTTGPRRIDRVIPGTDNNGGKPGTLRIRFVRRGTFTYYCRFHSHLDSSNQPVAPGPDGGIADSNGNYGTPMMGVIVVR